MQLQNFIINDIKPLSLTDEIRDLQLLLTFVLHRATSNFKT